MPSTAEFELKPCLKITNDKISNIDDKKSNIKCIAKIPGYKV